MKPRSDKEDTCNFSVTLTVLPLCKEPYLDRRRTLNYEKKRGVDFETAASGAVDRAEFVFDLPTDRKFHPGDAFLEVDLFHQLPYREVQLNFTPEIKVYSRFLFDTGGGRGITSRTWVGLTLILAITLSA